jgi:hypothetical protein
MSFRRSLLVLFALIASAACLISCSTANPNIGRVLTSINVTPATADAQTYPNGVVFTATGTFSLPPSPVPVTFTAPYSGEFVVDNPASGAVANVISTGTGTVTVQCVADASGMVAVTASALANNGSSQVVSGSAELTCP